MDYDFDDGGHIRGAVFEKLVEDDPELIGSLCAETDPYLFFPGEGDSHLTKEAKKVCHICPIEKRCLDYAIRNDEEHGVWGGMTHSERIRERRRRKLIGIA